MGIDQLAEVFRHLGKSRVPVQKAEKRLEDARQRWDAIKKSQPQVKAGVGPIQQSQGDRITQEIADFTQQVRASINVSA